MPISSNPLSLPDLPPSAGSTSPMGQPVLRSKYQTLQELHLDLTLTHYNFASIKLGKSYSCSSNPLVTGLIWRWSKGAFQVGAMGQLYRLEYWPRAVSATSVGSITRGIAERSWAGLEKSSALADTRRHYRRLCARALGGQVSRLETW